MPSSYTVLQLTLISASIIVLLCAGGFCHGEFGQRVKDTIVMLCEEVWQGGWCGATGCPPLPPVPLQLKDEAVSLADVLAPPDAILQSAIGRENGEVKATQMTIEVTQLVTHA